MVKNRIWKLAVATYFYMKKYEIINMLSSRNACQLLKQSFCSFLEGKYHEIFIIVFADEWNF